MNFDAGEGSSSRFSHWSWWVGCLWAFAVGVWCIALPPASGERAAPAATEKFGGGRTFLVIVDSFRPENLNPELMPRMATWEATQRHVATCSANFTLPCIQTLLEGKQSPFAAGLANFTGEEGGAESLPAAWANAGITFRVISDHTLKSLYGEYSKETVNVETWPGNHIEHDIKALDVARDWAHKYPNDNALIHIIGTDKVSHHQQPGSSAYEAHWVAVDRALRDFLDTLKPTDNIIVTGDHGHQNLGHHTRHSIALFRGPRFAELFDALNFEDPLEQTDLLYFLSYASGVTLPADYEGRFWETPPREAPASLQTFVNAQHRALGSDDASIAEAYAHARAAKMAQSHRHPLEFIGAILLAAGLFGWTLRHRNSVTPLGALKLGVLSMLAIASVAWPSVWLGVGLGLAAIVGFYKASRDGKDRLIWTGVLVILAMASLTSAFAEPWRDFFHTRGGVHPAWFAFYAGVIASGVAGSYVAFRTVRFAPEAAMLLGIFVLPSGVYYYQAGQNFMTGVVFGTLVISTAALVRGYRPHLRQLAGVTPLLGGLVFFMLQESGGWEWSFFPHRWLDRLGYNACVAVIALTVIVTTSYQRQRRKRWVLAAVAIIAFVYAVLIGGLPVERFATASFVVMFVTAWTAWMERTRKDLPAEYRDWGHSAILLGAQLFTGWMLIDGYRLNNVDFSFALDWFGAIHNEAIVFALTQVATSLKYGAPLLVMMVSLRGLLGHARFKSVTFGAMLLGLFELLILVLQILFGQAFQTERLWELGIADITFEADLVIMIPMMAMFIFTADWLARRGLADLSKKL